jgi:hypothetical protein
MRDRIESAVGYILALVAIAFGVVGWLIGMGGTSVTGLQGSPQTWFFSGMMLGILALGVVLDESRFFADVHTRRTSIALSWLVMLIALCVGAVGFITGLMGGPTTQAWLFSGIILAIVSVAIMADEGRRLRASSQAVGDEIAGGVLSLVAVILGAIGFLEGVVGLSGLGPAENWFFGGFIVAVAATAFMFDGERRAAMAAASDRIGVEGFRRTTTAGG